MLTLLLQQLPAKRSTVVSLSLSLKIKYGDDDAAFFPSLWLKRSDLVILDNSNGIITSLSLVIFAVLLLLQDSLFSSPSIFPTANDDDTRDLLFMFLKTEEIVDLLNNRRLAGTDSIVLLSPILSSLSLSRNIDTGDDKGETNIDSLSSLVHLPLLQSLPSSSILS